jgi:glutamine amidotransferase
MIAVVDYGMGNLRSLANALDSLGADVEVVSGAEGLGRADRIVLPGVGAFGDAMRSLRERGLDEALAHEVVAGGKPVLGICLGMQLMASASAEHGSHRGLGWIDAEVTRLPPGPGLKIPHVGWNSVRFDRSDWLFAGIRESESNFYFVHSFHVRCTNPADVVAVADHGIPLTAAIRRGRLVATQFHPEKSQDNGVRLLRNWLDWDPGC